MPHLNKPHKNLDVWKKSIELVVHLYRIVGIFPSDEKYALVSQIKRAAVSIPSNIAEGAARNTKKEFINYLHISQGSLSELDTQIEISIKLGFISASDFKQIENIMIDIDKMLSGLIRSLKK